MLLWVVAALSLLTVLAIVPFVIWAVLLTKPTGPSKSVKKAPLDTSVVETTAWVNQLVIHWMGAMLLSGGTGDAAIISDRLQYVLTRALSPPPPPASSSSSSVPTTMSKMSTAPGSPAPSATARRSSHSIHPTPSAGGPMQRQSSAISEAESMRSSTTAPRSFHTHHSTSLASGVHHHPHTHRQTGFRPRIKSLRLSNGSDGVVRMPVIGSISSAEIADPPFGLPSTHPTTDRLRTFEFRVPLSFDDLGFLMSMDCDVPLLFGISHAIAPDLATLRTDVELKTLRIDIVLLVTVTGNVITMSLESLPRWESKITTKFGSKMQSVQGGAKMEEIARLALTQAFSKIVRPHALQLTISPGDPKNPPNWSLI